MQINRLADFCRTVRVPVIWVRQNITVNATGDNAGLYPAFHDRSNLRKHMQRERKERRFFQKCISILPWTTLYSRTAIARFVQTHRRFQRSLIYSEKGLADCRWDRPNVCVESTVRDAMQLDFLD